MCLRHTSLALKPHRSSCVRLRVQTCELLFPGVEASSIVVAPLQTETGVDVEGDDRVGFPCRSGSSAFDLRARFNRDWDWSALYDEVQFPLSIAANERAPDHAHHARPLVPRHPNFDPSDFRRAVSRSGVRSARARAGRTPYPRRSGYRHSATTSRRGASRTLRSLATPHTFVSLWASR